jgi:hypothetical protein
MFRFWFSHKAEANNPRKFDDQAQSCSMLQLCIMCLDCSFVLTEIFTIAAICGYVQDVLYSRSRCI